jgi:hypothetical protein
MGCHNIQTLFGQEGGRAGGRGAGNLRGGGISLNNMRFSADDDDDNTGL